VSPELSLESARAQDAADPLSRHRAAFHFPVTPDGRPVTYLCGNSLGLQPRRAVDEVGKFMQEWQRLGVLGYHDPQADWLNLHERLAPTAAALAGARLPEVVVMHSLTINLHLLMASFYRPVRDRRLILIEQGAFPSDRYAVASQLDWHGLGRDALVQAGPRPGETLLSEPDPGGAGRRRRRRARPRACDRQRPARAARLGRRFRRLVLLQVPEWRSRRDRRRLRARAPLRVEGAAALGLVGK
jgi:kynureninase